MAAKPVSPCSTLAPNFFVGSFGVENASQYCTMNIPIVHETETCQSVIAKLIGTNYDAVGNLVVCSDNNRFVGIVKLESLLAAPESTIADLVDRNAPFVAPGTDQEVAAWHAVRHQESALSVVDSKGDFIGLVPPYQLVGILLKEHDEDLSRVGGFLHATQSVRSSSEEPVERRLWHRVPWLIVGLAGALAAADIVANFETQLQSKLMLAFFIPGVVYLADAVGTQTETIVVRGLSVGVGIERMVGRELAAGLAIGALLCLLAGPIVWWHWSDGIIALAVTLSIFAACSTATITAMFIPWLLTKCRCDPAFGTGPLATVIQDLLSVIIYFTVATWVLALKP